MIGLLLAALVLMPGCRSPLASGPPPAGPTTMVCQVFYRPSVTESLDEGTTIILATDGDDRDIQFDDLVFNARYSDDEYEGRSLVTTVYASDTGAEVVRQLYQLDLQEGLSNQFLGGHGFTGLSYVYHPVSGAELQYFCEAGPAPAPTSASTGAVPDMSEWRVHRHENLGVEIRYPPTWQVDSQEWFVWFHTDPASSQGFNIANANFGMTTPDEFLDHLEIPVEMTRTLLLDGQRALFVGLQPVPEAQGYRSVVAVVTPYGENLTIGNRGDAAVFEQALATLRFFEPAHGGPVS